MSKSGAVYWHRIRAVDWREWSNAACDPGAGWDGLRGVGEEVWVVGCVL